MRHRRRLVGGLLTVCAGTREALWQALLAALQALADYRARYRALYEQLKQIGGPLMSTLLIVAERRNRRQARASSGRRGGDHDGRAPLGPRDEGRHGTAWPGAPGPGVARRGLAR